MSYTKLNTHARAYTMHNTHAHNTQIHMHIIHRHTIGKGAITSPSSYV